MDYIAIFKRAFKLTIKYRALWLFGFFLALCSGSSGGNGNFSSPGSGGEFDGNPDESPQIRLGWGSG